MANVAQTINCLHSLFLAHEEKFVRTPVYYVFQMYQGHQGGKLVPMELGGEQSVTAVEGVVKMPVLNGSASVNGAGMLTVTLSNPSLDSGVAARLRIEGGRAVEAVGQVLTHEDRQAGNTFEKPGEVGLKSLAASVEGGVVRVAIPKQSVVSLNVRMS
jgi:alpha-N-arabinofuranosidase